MVVNPADAAVVEIDPLVDSWDDGKLLGSEIMTEPLALVEVVNEGTEVGETSWGGATVSSTSRVGRVDNGRGGW